MLKIVEAIIDRKPTEAERKEFIPIGEKTTKMKILEKLREKEKEYTKSMKPFDFQCARIDLEDQFEKMEKETARSSKESVSFEIPDFDKYGKIERFKLLAEVEEKEPNPLNRKFMEIVGYTKQFICKERGHGISVFTPIQYKETEKKR